MSAQLSSGQPGWLPDPSGRFESRYWDGAHWTDAVMRGGQVESDPDGKPAASSVDAPIPPDPPLPRQAVMPHAAPPAPTDRFTSLPAADAQTRLSQMLPMSGVTVTQVAPGRIDGMVTVKDEPNIVVLIVLLLVWILPGLIYWYMKSKPVTERFSLVFVPVATGTRISVQAGPKTMGRLVPVMGQLPW
jgi:Protein of unknown function (DUF2510)